MTLICWSEFISLIYINGNSPSSVSPCDFKVSSTSALYAALRYVASFGQTWSWLPSGMDHRFESDTLMKLLFLPFSCLVFLSMRFLLSSNILVWHSPMPFLNLCALPVIDEWPYKNSPELTTPPSLDQLQGCWLGRESLTGTCIKQMPNKVSQKHAFPLHTKHSWGMGFMDADLANWAYIKSQW